MIGWSLAPLLDGLHDSIEQRLTSARTALRHPVMKGDSGELIWLDFLNTYLPTRYQATRAVVVDSNDNFSEQIDIVIHDRNFTPFIFNQDGQHILPAESVYAVFEAKQSLNAKQVTYAGDKAASVRKLHRTSLPVPNIYGKADPKPLQPILAGILTLESDWSPPLGRPLHDALASMRPEQLIDIGCVAAHGIFTRRDGKTETDEKVKPVTAFLLELIANLQASATVPMIDVRAYARWLR